MRTARFTCRGCSYVRLSKSRGKGLGHTTSEGHAKSSGAAVGERNAEVNERISGPSEVLYPADREETKIAGVHAYVYTPKAGVSPANRNRVLINLHGGGFPGCWPACAELESIPIAALARIRVISLDYREGPQYKFPAASEDVAAAYQEVLKDHTPQNVGIYGCSAGGMLTRDVRGVVCKAPASEPRGCSQLLGRRAIGLPGQVLRSAIATGLVDHVLPVEEMPTKPREYVSYLRSTNRNSTGVREQLGKHIGKIHGLLRRKVGHDFSQYKETTITRRLSRRMKALQIDTVEQYVPRPRGRP